MPSPMYLPLLQQAGLNEKEAFIYEKMLELGPCSVGKLRKNTPYKRGDLYNILYALRDKGLAAEELKDGIITFTLAEPEKLHDLVKREEDRIEQCGKALHSALPDMKS